jgi:hypothetical protein
MPFDSSVDLNGPPPLGVKPHKNAEYTDFHGADLHDAHLPNVCQVRRGNIDQPRHTGCGEQSPETFFGAHTEKASFRRLLLLLRRLRNRHNRNEFVGRLGIALPPAIPVDVIVLAVIGHPIQGATEGPIGEPAVGTCTPRLVVRTGAGRTTFPAQADILGSPGRRYCRYSRDIRSRSRW